MSINSTSKKCLLRFDLSCLISSDSCLHSHTLSPSSSISRELNRLGALLDTGHRRH
jgi:hypothetical protein